jgi:hypothetical protein
MRVIAKDMRSTLDAFKKDLNGSLPRQVWAVVHRFIEKVKENA